MKKSIITISSNAADYIRTTIQEKGELMIGLRVSLETGGCSGFKYAFDYVDEENPKDEKIEAHGITVYVDQGAVLRVIGSEMDYESSDFSSGFVFRNPNETGSCGCGESVKF